MKTCVAAVLLLFSVCCHSEGGVNGKPPQVAAYPETEAATAWRGLAASYIRKAIKDKTLVGDVALNARVDSVMKAVGTAVADIAPRFADAAWRAILIEDFGNGAVSFPDGTVIVDAKFVAKLQLNDHELALILCHEVAHVLAGHAVAKLSFMAEFLGKDKLPDAYTALQEFLARNSYAVEFQPTAQKQEREADTLGAAIFFAAGFDAQQAGLLFDKLALLETHGPAAAPDPHDTANLRKQLFSETIAEHKRLRAQRVSATR